MSDIESSVRLASRELRVQFDVQRLLRLDLTPSQVSQTLRSKLQGAVATRYTKGEREFDVRVAVTEGGLATRERLETLLVANHEGVPIFLDSVATIDAVRGPSEIRRIGQQRAAVVSANVVGRDMGSVSAELADVVRELEASANVSIEMGGQDQEMNRSLASLVLGTALACFLVYLVMASQFESFLHPFIVVTSLPFAGIGVVVALQWTGHTLSVVAMIGIVMLAGIVVNNAIVLIDAINQRRQRGTERAEAIVEAAESRLRPIAMTTATTVLGLLPMALGMGPGAELRASMAVTVIGGLVAGTLTTLILVPIIYGMLDFKRFGDAGSGEAASNVTG